MVFTILLFWVFASACVKGLPIENQLQDANGNSTILKGTTISGWTNSPSFRGTGDILWSCLVTILAAVYTAVHPDIPARHESQWERFKIRVKWAFVALIAPEMMLRVAMKQFFSARALLKQLNGASAMGNTITTAPAEKYDMAYAFYIEMGGFVVDTSHISNKHSLVALTARGAKHLAKAGHTFEVDLDQLADRSKSGTLGKALVCFQVSWMFLQCVARGVAGYSLTLLEIHTMTHAVCAILIYIFWWHKPNDIGESQLWDAKGFEDVIALLVMSEPTCSGSKYDMYSELDLLGFSQNTETSSQAIVNTTIDDQDRTVRIKVGEYLPYGLGPKLYSRNLDVKDLERWRLAAKALGRSELVSQKDLRHPTLGKISKSCAHGVATAQHARNTTGSEWQIWNPLSIFPILLSWIKSEGIVSCIAVFLLPLIYGGVHLTAWNFQFPSLIEGYSWKLSSIVVMSVGLATLLMTLLAGYTLDRLDKIGKGRLSHCSTGILGLWALLAMMCSVSLFTVCRLYLVVESFISLRDLPLGAFATTPWLQAIPHI